MLHDFGPQLAETEASRALRDLMESFSAPSRLSTIVLTGASIELPPEIEAVRAIVAA